MLLTHQKSVRLLLGQWGHPRPTTSHGLRRSLGPIDSSEHGRSRTKQSAPKLGCLITTKMVKRGNSGSEEKVALTLPEHHHDTKSSSCSRQRRSPYHGSEMCPARLNIPCVFVAWFALSGGLVCHKRPKLQVKRGLCGVSKAKLSHGHGRFIIHLCECRTNPSEHRHLGILE